MTSRLATLLVTLSLAACGGGGSGGSDGTQTGRLLDSAVSNISYKTETKQGKTTAKGEFEYKPGETVTFFIGETEFPPVDAAAIITPLDMSSTGQIDDPVVSNILILLQSLDADGDLSNGITISANAAAASAPIDFDQSTDLFIKNTAVINLILNGGQENPEIVLLVEAQEHFTRTLLGIAGDYEVTPYQVTYELTEHGVTPCQHTTVPTPHDFKITRSGGDYSCDGSGVSDCVAWDLDDKGIYFSYQHSKTLEMLVDGTGNLIGTWIINIPEEIGGGTTNCGIVTATPL